MAQSYPASSGLEDCWSKKTEALKESGGVIEKDFELAVLRRHVHLNKADCQESERTFWGTPARDTLCGGHRAGLWMCPSGVMWGQLWEYGAMPSYMLPGHCTTKERSLFAFLSFTKSILPVCSCIASLLFAGNIILLASLDFNPTVRIAVICSWVWSGWDENQLLQVWGHGKLLVNGGFPPAVLYGSELFPLVKELKYLRVLFTSG